MATGARLAAMAWLVALAAETASVEVGADSAARCPQALPWMTTHSDRHTYARCALRPGRTRGVLAQTAAAVAARAKGVRGMEKWVEISAEAVAAGGRVEAAAVVGLMEAVAEAREAEVGVVEARVRVASTAESVAAGLPGGTEAGVMSTRCCRCCTLVGSQGPSQCSGASRCHTSQTDCSSVHGRTRHDPHQHKGCHICRQLHLLPGSRAQRVELAAAAAAVVTAVEKASLAARAIVVAREGELAPEVALAGRVDAARSTRSSPGTTGTPRTCSSTD